MASSLEKQKAREWLRATYTDYSLLPGEEGRVIESRWNDERAAAYGRQCQREALRWTPACERLPETCKDGETPSKYRVWDAYWEEQYDAYYIGDFGGGPSWDAPNREPGYNITHWMPLPAPPVADLDTEAEAGQAQDSRPPMPVEEYDWYSVCSAHQQYQPSCGCCNAGRWISRRQHEYEHWLYKHYPKVWKVWANRPEDEGRKFLERIFPGLRPKSSGKAEAGTPEKG